MVNFTESTTIEPSASVSFAKTLIAIKVFCVADTLSRLAKGALFGMAFTVITTKAVSHKTGAPLSQTR